MGAKKKIPKGLDIEEVVAAAEQKERKAANEQKKTNNSAAIYRKKFFIERKENSDQVSEEISESVKKKSEMHASIMDAQNAEENRRKSYAKVVEKQLNEKKEDEGR